MDDPTKEQIIKHEEKLRLAMLQSDLEVLNELLSPELIFTNHLGHVMTKTDDLAAHQSGLLNIEELTISEQNIQLVRGIAMVFAQAHILGSYDGNKSEADFRFTRIWTSTTRQTWHIIVAHSSIVV